MLGHLGLTKTRGTPNLIPSLPRGNIRNYKWVGKLRGSVSGGPRGAEPPHRKDIEPAGPHTLYNLKL